MVINPWYYWPDRHRWRGVRLATRYGQRAVARIAIEETVGHQGRYDGGWMLMLFCFCECLNVDC